MVTSSHPTKGMTLHWALVKMVLNVWVPKKAGPKQISSRQDFVPDSQVYEWQLKQTGVYVHTNKKHSIPTHKQDISNKNIFFNLLTDDGSSKDS